MEKETETQLDTIIAKEKDTFWGQLKLISMLKQARIKLKRDDYIEVENKIMEGLKDQGIIEIPLGAERVTNLLEEEERGKVPAIFVILDQITDELRKRGYSEEHIRRAKGGLTRQIQIELYKVSCLAKERGIVPKVLTFEICDRKTMKKDLEAELKGAIKFVKKWKLDYLIKDTLAKSNNPEMSRILALEDTLRVFKAVAEKEGVDFSKMPQIEQLRRFEEYLKGAPKGTLINRIFG